WLQKACEQGLPSLNAGELAEWWRNPDSACEQIRKYESLALHIPARWKAYKKNWGVMRVPLRPSGRPRKDDVRVRVKQLRDAGKSWQRLCQQLNREFGQNLTPNAYRNLLSRNRK